MLKFDQWSHHWECVLTALLKCKADSNDYDYTTNFLPHIQISNPIKRIGNEYPTSYSGGKDHNASPTKRRSQSARSATQSERGCLGTAPRK